MAPRADRSSIGVRVRPNADNFIKDLRAKLETKKATFYADVGAKTGKATEDVRKWANTTLKNISARVPVEADTSRADRDMSAWRKAQESNALHVNVDLDFKRADAQMAAWHAKWAAKNIEFKLKLDRSQLNDLLGGLIKAAKMDVDLQTAGAEARAELLRKEIKARPAQMDVDVDPDSLRMSMRRIRREFGRLGTFRIDVGLFSLGAGSGIQGTLSAAVGLAEAGPAAAFAVTGLAQALTQLAGAAAIVPGALSAVLASIGTMALGFKGVGEAFKALGDLWGESTDKQEKQARLASDAHNGLRNSLVDEARAQKDVADARRDALNDLRNLNNELKRGVLNEAQAILDIQKAEDRLAKGGFKTQTDLNQAILDRASAYQSLDEVRERNAQRGVEAQEKMAAGVEGSDQVVNAVENLTRATQAMAAAQAAVKETAVAGATAKFNDQLALLSPNARAFVETIAGFKGPLQDFKNSIQDITFEGLAGKAAEAITGLLPSIQPGMEAVAKGINANLQTVFDTLNSSDGRSILERIFGGTAEMQQAMTQFWNPFVRGFGTLAAAGAEHMPQLVDLFTRLAERFALFIEKADANGSLDRFMDRGIEGLGHLVEIGVNLIQIIDRLGEAFGGDLLKQVSDVTAKIEEWLDKPENFQKVVDMVNTAKEEFKQWRPILEKIPGVMSAISEGARKFLDVVLPVIEKLVNMLNSIPGVVETVFGAYLLGKITGPFLNAFKVIKGSFNILMDGMRLALGRGLPTPPVTPPVPPGAPAVGAAAAGAGAGAVGYGAVATPAFAGAAAVIGLTLLIEAMNTPTPESHARKRRTLSNRGLGQLTKPSPREWIEEAGDEEERKRRERWVAGNITNTRDLDRDFEPPKSYAQGGYTNWGRTQGVMAELHGGEYVQPYDTTDYYGLGIMRALHERRIPREALKGYEIGGKIPDEPHGLGLGALPGPADLLSPGGVGVGEQQTMNLFGFNFPIGNGPLVSGWGPGGAPIGLGGGPPGPNGEAPFDIRNFGIGPGPAGSSPSDWAKWTTDFAGATITNFGEATLRGFLGFFGAEGVLDSPYANALRGTVAHFAEAGNNTEAVGPDVSSAQFGSLMDQFYGMPGNPAYPGLPPGVSSDGTTSLPGLDPNEPVSGGILKGLQPATARGEALIRKHFPWATNIGGVRADPLPWHPNGLALDVMTDPGHGNNDPPSPQGLKRGNELYAWLKRNQAALGIDYILWQEKDHYNHLHVNFAPSGPGGAQPSVTAPKGETKPGSPAPKNWGLGSKPSAPAPKSAPAGPMDLYSDTPWMVPGKPKVSSGSSIFAGFYNGGLVPNAYVDPWGGGGWWHGSPGENWGVVTPGGGPPIGAWSGGETLDPSRMWPGPVDGPDLPQSPGWEHIGSGAWWREFPNTRRIDPVPPWRMPQWTGGIQGFYRGGRVPSFATGGINNYPRGVVIKPRPPKPPPDARQIAPRPRPSPIAPSLPVGPKAPPNLPGSLAPQPGGPADPNVPHVPGGPPGPVGPPLPPPETTVAPVPQVPQNPPGQPDHRDFGPGIGPGPGVQGSKVDYLHPAASKGIRSGAATLGSLADKAAAAGSFGFAALGGGGGGGLGGGGGGLSIGGAIQQGGKIVEGIANAASALLVGTVTNGTTENPYGVTQMPSAPSGATIRDNSTHYHGDMYTQNLDDYFKRMDLREAQKAQASFAGYDRYS